MKHPETGVLQFILEWVWVWGLTHRRVIKGEIITINTDLVYNKACILSHDIHVYPTLNNVWLYFWNINSKSRLSYNSFKFVHKINIQNQLLYALLQKILN